MENNTIIIKKSQNEIHFNGDINNKNMSQLIGKLIDLESDCLKKCRNLKRKFKNLEKDDEDEKNYSFKLTPKPIKLYITSNGGSVHQVFSAIDTIKSLKIPVDTYVKGFAASAGTLLSLAGSKKYITENSYMLIHEVRSGMWGKFTDLKEEYENVSLLHDHIINYYVKNTKLTKEELIEQLKKDSYWAPEKCLETGLVDEIIKN
jgi:ATP-dependent Clp endopeptidase proteolytic subunit ClpP